MISARSVKPAATTSDPISQTTTSSSAKSAESGVALTGGPPPPPPKPLGPTAVVARSNGRYLTMSGRKIEAKPSPK